jgi:NMD protein affecting ribosome stability and mRNA decay
MVTRSRSFEHLTKHYSICLPSDMSRRKIICVQCSKEGPHAARGLCNRCYKAQPEIAERSRQTALEWYHCHADEANARQLAYRHTPEGNKKRNNRLREAYAEDPTKRKEAVSRYQKNHPDKTVVRFQRHRAKKLNLPGDHTNEEWALRLKEYNSRCAYCLKLLNRPTEDHMIPVSQKGSNNNIENIVPACVSCNARKCDKTLLQFVIVTRGKF